MSKNIQKLVKTVSFIQVKMQASMYPYSLVLFKSLFEDGQLILILQNYYELSLNMECWCFCCPVCMQQHDSEWAGCRNEK